MLKQFKREKSAAKPSQASAAVGALWEWAYAPERDEHPVALFARAVLEQCVRLCDQQAAALAAIEHVKALEAALAQCRAELARQRRLAAEAQA